ncbi:hypothetical protein [uncultured Sphingomonas sp.]|uniref:hypothetical protein n=1 Tax=uncultured Sphingomonas sp. TaxID=158754 RepID=UPI00260957C0|nr:hypothetical protein [uncultured Sphingomonas sp.]
MTHVNARKDSPAVPWAGARVGGLMAIQRDHRIDLGSPEIQAFVLNQQSQEWYERSIPPAGFSASGATPKLSGRIDADPNARAIRMPFCLIETYDVLEGSAPGSPGVTVGTFDVNVPSEQQVVVEVYADLFARDGIADAAKTAIIAAFDAFDPASGQDPDDYMATVLRADAGLQPSMFRTNLFARVRKGQVVEHTEERDRKLAPYRGAGPGSVWDRSGAEHRLQGDPGYFVQRRLSAKRVGTRLVSSVPVETPNPYRIEAPAAEFDRALDVVVNREAENASCSGDEYQIQKWKIATLLTFPEFMVVWRDLEINIGCGVHIVLSYPVLQIRWSDLTLYAFARYPSDLGKLIENAVTDCAWKAALAGAVIGVAMGNFASAIAAFKALFTECLKAKFQDVITCMLPGLALDAEVKQQWQDI